MGNPNPPEISRGGETPDRRNREREGREREIQVALTIYSSGMVLLFMKACQRNPAESFSYAVPKE